MSEKKDCLYGKVAIAAAGLAAGNKMTPQEVWKKACDVIWPDKTRHKSCRKKGCPQNAFLGLCEVGMIKKIPKESDTATPPVVNKDYAIKAVEILIKDSNLSKERYGYKTKLWKKVMEELGKETSKSQNNQMDVVLSLWNKGYIVDEDGNSLLGD